MVLLTMFTIVVAWLIAALFLAGIVFSFAFKNFDIGYAKGLKEGSTTHSAIRSECLKWAYDQGLQDGCRRRLGDVGTILADNADLDEIMVIRYDDQLPHRYKRIID